MGVVPVRRLLGSFRMKALFGAILCAVILVTTVLSRNVEEVRLKRDAAGDVFHGSVPVVDPHTIQDVADLKTLKQVHVIFRHGDRTPIDRFPKDPYDSRKFWPEGFGQLTRIGKYMQFSLGQYLRNRYDGFLSKEYAPEEIYVQSSSIDRTIVSAMANMAGLFPPTKDDLKFPVGAQEQYVPVHSISPPEDNKIAFTKACPRYAQLRDAVFEEPSEKRFNLEHAELYKYLSEHTGLNITNYYNVSDIYDTLFVQKCHNLEHPPWAHSVFPDKLLPLAQRWIKAATFNEEMKILKAGPLVSEIVSNMKAAAGLLSSQQGVLQRVEDEGAVKVPAKMYAYSGHDTTLSAVLDALGLFTGEWPPYATSLYLELHELEEPSKLAVKLFYRAGLVGKADKVEFKSCKSSPCLLSDFAGALSGYTLDESEWQRKCKLK